MVRAAGVLALSLATATTAVAAAPSASADGNTWSYIDGADGYLRHFVRGDGLKITSQTAKVELGNGEALCNFYINWVYLDRYSRPWYTERAYTNTGCVSGSSPYSYQTVVNVYRGAGTAKDGYACAYLFTGSWQRGRACVRITP